MDPREVRIQGAAVHGGGRASRLLSRRNESEDSDRGEDGASGSGPGRVGIAAHPPGEPRGLSEGVWARGGGGFLGGLFLGPKGPRAGRGCGGPPPKGGPAAPPPPRLTRVGDPTSILDDAGGRPGTTGHYIRNRPSPSPELIFTPEQRVVAARRPSAA